MKNYIVWSPERGLPTKTHGGVDAATSEASRLAAKHPGIPFHVYGLIGTASASVSVDFRPADEPCPAHLAYETVSRPGPAVALPPPLLSYSDPVPSERPRGWVELGPGEVIETHDLLWSGNEKSCRQWADGFVGRSVGCFCTHLGDRVLRHPSRHKTSTPEKLADDGVAKGHNPLRLTNAEVGVAEGWRLLKEDELWPRRHVWGDGIEFSASNRRWVVDFGDVCESSFGWTFRTKKPEGHYRRKC